MTHMGLVGTLLKPIDALVLMVAAVCHDIDHKGFTNGYAAAGWLNVGKDEFAAVATLANVIEFRALTPLPFPFIFSRSGTWRLSSRRLRCFTPKGRSWSGITCPPPLPCLVSPSATSLLRYRVDNGSDGGGGVSFFFKKNFFWVVGDDCFDACQQTPCQAMGNKGCLSMRTCARRLLGLLRVLAFKDVMVFVFRSLFFAAPVSWTMTTSKSTPSKR